MWFFSVKQWLPWKLLWEVDRCISAYVTSEIWNRWFQRSALGTSSGNAMFWIEESCDVSSGTVLHTCTHQVHCKQKDGTNFKTQKNTKKKHLVVTWNDSCSWPKCPSTSSSSLPTLGDSINIQPSVSCMKWKDSIHLVFDEKKLKGSRRTSHCVYIYIYINRYHNYTISIFWMRTNIYLLTIQTLQIVRWSSLHASYIPEVLERYDKLINEAKLSKTAFPTHLANIPHQQHPPTCIPPSSRIARIRMRRQQWLSSHSYISTILGPLSRGAMEKKGFF